MHREYFVQFYTHLIQCLFVEAVVFFGFVFFFPFICCIFTSHTKFKNHFFPFFSFLQQKNISVLSFSTRKHIDTNCVLVFDWNIFVLRTHDLKPKIQQQFLIQSLTHKFLHNPIQSNLFKWDFSFAFFVVVFFSVFVCLFTMVPSARLKCWRAAVLVCMRVGYIRFEIQLQFSCHCMGINGKTTRWWRHSVCME